MLHHFLSHLRTVYSMILLAWQGLIHLSFSGLVRLYTRGLSACYVLELCMVQAAVGVTKTEMP